MKNLSKEPLIKLSQNENPLGPSPEAIKAIITQTEQCSVYPENHSDSVKKIIGKKFAIASSKIFISAGLIESLDILIRNFVQNDEHLMVGEYSFAAYRQLAEVFNKNIRFAAMENYFHSLEGILHQYNPERTKLIIIDNPNNPTGSYLTNEDLLTLLNTINPKTILVVDEAYCEYVSATNYPQTIALLESYPNLIIMRSFSKIYGLAGLRIGYCFASENMVKNLEHFQAPFTVNQVAAMAASAALFDDDFISKSHQMNRTEMTRICDQLEQLKVAFIPSQANFILLPFGKSDKRNQLFDYLSENQILARKTDFFGAINCLRISIGLPEQNDVLMGKLARFFSM